MKVYKTIQMETIKMDAIQFSEAANFFKVFSIVYNGLSPFVCSNKRRGKNFRQIRNEVKKHPFLLNELANKVRKETRAIGENEKIARWLWTMAVHSVFSNVSTHRTNCLKRVKCELSKMTTDDEYALLCYLLAIKPFVCDLIQNSRTPLPVVKNKKIIDLINSTDEEKIRKLLLCSRRRLIQLDITCKTKKANWMSLDKDGYQVIQEKGKTQLRISPLSKKGSPLFVNLKGVFYTSKAGKPGSNITVVLDWNKKVIRIQRHPLIKVKKHPTWKIRVAVDRGINCPIASSDGMTFDDAVSEKRYKQLLIEDTEKRLSRNSKLQKYISKINQLEKDVSSYRELARKENFETENVGKINENKIYSNVRKVSRIRKNNIGERRYLNECNHRKRRMENCLNINVNNYIKSLNDDISVIYLEDLYICGKRGNKKVNSELSSWMSGYLRKRIEYKASLKGIETKLVNAAYSSKYCADCGSKISRDSSDLTKGICPNCGIIHADINAAKNLLWVAENPELFNIKDLKVIKDQYEKRYEVIKNNLDCQ